MSALWMWCHNCVWIPAPFVFPSIPSSLDTCRKVGYSHSQLPRKMEGGLPFLCWSHSPSLGEVNQARNSISFKEHLLHIIRSWAASYFSWFGSGSFSCFLHMPLILLIFYYITPYPLLLIPILQPLWNCQWTARASFTGFSFQYASVFFITLSNGLLASAPLAMYLSSSLLWVIHLGVSWL